MASAYCEQLGTDVDNNENYFTKEKEDGEVFGRWKEQIVKKKLHVGQV